MNLHLFPRLQTFLRKSLHTLPPASNPESGSDILSENWNGLYKTKTTLSLMLFVKVKIYCPALKELILFDSIRYPCFILSDYISLDRFFTNEQQQNLNRQGSTLYIQLYFYNHFFLEANIMVYEIDLKR